MNKLLKTKKKIESFVHFYLCTQVYELIFFYYFKVKCDLISVIKYCYSIVGSITEIVLAVDINVRVMCMFDPNLLRNYLFLTVIKYVI